jgi:hypothetical protein
MYEKRIVLSEDRVVRAKWVEEWDVLGFSSFARPFFLIGWMDPSIMTSVVDDSFLLL